MNHDELITTGRWALVFTNELHASLAGYPYLFDVLVIIVSLAVGGLVAWLTRRVFVYCATALYARRATVDDSVRIEIIKIASALVWMLPIGAMGFWSYVDGMHRWLVLILLRVSLAACACLFSSALLHGVNLLGIWYRGKLAAKNRPIDGILTTVRVFIVLAGAICAVALLFGKSPIYLLSALGAVAAVLMIVFQDSLLSLAASVQVNCNGLVNIGDWIVQEDKGVDGMVETMTLHTVRVRNWDETVVALPVRTLVDEPFVNMTRMQESGSRRYMRQFLVDYRSVRFLRKTELDELHRFDRLFGKSFAPEGKGVTEVRPHGPTPSGDRHQTNLGAFRAYLKNYLSNHPFVRADKMLVVSVLDPTSQGVPLMVYAFLSKTGYQAYSEVAADITEHVLAVLPSFHLRMFQECSDIYQSVCDESENVDGLFQYETYANPES